MLSGSIDMVGNMLLKLLVLVAITVADINIDINISGEEEALMRGVESSEGRNTTSTVVNNSNNNLREVAENCSEKKVGQIIRCYLFHFHQCLVGCYCFRLGWVSRWCSAS